MQVLHNVQSPSLKQRWNWPLRSMNVNPTYGSSRSGPKFNTLKPKTERNLWKGNWSLLRYSCQKASSEHHFLDRKSTRLNSSHVKISYAVFCLKKKKKKKNDTTPPRTPCLSTTGIAEIL